MHKLETKEELEKHLAEVRKPLILSWLKHSFKLKEDYNRGKWNYLETIDIVKLATLEYMKKNNLSEQDATKLMNRYIELELYAVPIEWIEDRINKDDDIDALKNFFIYTLDYKIKRDIIPSVLNLSKTIQNEISEKELLQENIEGEIWRLNYLLLATYTDGAEFSKQDLESFKDNYEILKEKISKQYALIDLIRYLAEILDLPELRKNTLSVSNAALTEYKNLIERTGLDKYPELKNMTRLLALKGLSAAKRRKSAMTLESLKPINFQIIYERQDKDIAEERKTMITYVISNIGIFAKRISEALD